MILCFHSSVVSLLSLLANVTMTAHENPRPPFQDGVLEEKNCDDPEPEGHDHEASTDADSDHDTFPSDGHHDDVEAHSSPLTQPITITREKTRASGDLGLRRTASNVLTAVASRITTRGWPEPPPPPDGGFKAWLQVACVCLDINLPMRNVKNAFPLMLD